MKNFFAITFLVLLGVIFYTLTIRGAVGNPDALTIKATLEGETKPMELSPERGRFAHVMALADYGTYDLPKVLADFVYPDVGYIDDRFYVFFAPGISFMAVPFYEFGKNFDLSQVFTFALVSIVSIGAMIFMFLIARQIFEMPIWASIIAPILFAFGSSSWSYAITLYQHHFTVFFFMSGLYSAWRYGLNSRYSWLWGFVPWISYAAAFTVDYPNPLFLLPMMVYFFWKAWIIHRNDEYWRISFRPSFIFVSIGFLIITGWHLNFNSTNFGGWQKLAGGIPSYKTIITQERELLNFSTSSSKTIVEHVSSKEKSVIGFFSEKRLPYGGYILLFSSERGLLIFWPLIIPALFGVYLAYKRNKAEVSALMGGVIANMLLYLSWGDPWGGWAFGPRYLILSISILSIFAAYWITKGGIWKKIVLFELFAYSSFISIVGALTTNSVPPKVEAIPLGAEYTYFRNIDFLFQGKSGSFVYNTYLSSIMSLEALTAIIYLTLLFIMAVLLFVLPRKKNDN